MDVRQANTDDIPGIRSVAHRSLKDSYDFLDEEVIDRAVEQWYGDDSLERSLTDDNDVILVGVVDDEVAAFSQSAVIGEEGTVGEIRWLHVDPEYRHQGMGPALYDRTAEVLDKHGVGRVRGLVLAGNDAGTQFYEHHGMTKVGERSVEIGGETYTELVYETTERVPDVAAENVETRELDGRTVYVSFDEAERGSQGDFHPAYRDEERTELYAWLCSNCGSLDTAMDSMGQMQCNECGNVRKPTRWDASYL